MRGRTLAILGLAVLAVAAVVWLDRERPGSDERRRQADLLLPGLEPDRVRAVVLEAPPGAERPPVHLEREDDGWRIAAWKGDPLVVATDTLLAEELSTPPGGWVSHALTEHRAFDVTGMVVVDGGERLDFDRVGGDWSMDGEPVSYLPLSEVLNAVTEARAAELLPAGTGSPGPVTRSFTLRVENGVERVETIRFHGSAGEGGGVRVTVAGRPPVFVLGQGQAERIDTLLRELRQALD